MIRIGVIGYGYWGPNLVRNFSEVAGCRVTHVCDARGDRLALVEQRYPGMRTTTRHEDVLRDPQVDAVVVATPPATHYRLTLEALQAGKDVLVEKPLAPSSSEVMRLIDEADRRGCILQVDHTFVYSGAVRKMADLVHNTLGSLYYYDSVRANLGLFQSDVNVLWDLAVHDLSIMDYVLPSTPNAVSAIAVRHVPGRPEDLAYLTLHYDERLIAHVHVSWLAPVKVRRTLVAGSSKMIVYDELEPSEKIKVYDRGVTIAEAAANRHDLLIGYRMGDMLAPQIEVGEALRTEAIHFVDCVTRRTRPLTDGQAGLRVVQILEAAMKSLELRGQPIELEARRCVA
jgi:predicted dehydrogenase